MDNTEYYKIPDYFIPIKLSDSRTILRAPNKTITISIKKEEVAELIKKLKEGETLEHLVEETSLSQKQVYSVINYLKEKGVLESEDGLKYGKGYYHRHFSEKDIGPFLQNKKLLIIGAGPMTYRFLESFGFKENCDIKVWDEKEIKKSDNEMYPSNESVKYNSRIKFIEDKLDIETISGDFKVIENQVEKFDLVLLFDTRLDRTLQMKINSACFETNTEFLPVRLEEDSLMIGPYVVPKEKACLNCLDERIKSNKDVPDLKEQYYSSFDLHNSGITVPPHTLGIIESIVVDEVIKGLSGIKKPQTLETMIEYQTYSYELNRHNTPKNPFCAVCGRKNAN